MKIQSRNFAYIFLVVNFAIIQCQMTNFKGITDNTIENTLSVVGKGRSAKLKTISNRKPVFRDCEDYKPQVKEEQSAGAFVIKVQAEDGDPVDAGGIVTYRIVKRDGERAYFNINNMTGEVTTTQPFDRDEPARQKELYVTVQASDNGRPPLADICTIKVVVTDINDNTPSFDSFEYNTKVSEDLKPKSEVMRVFAYDLDDGDNSKLSYNFSENELFSKYFRIDKDTGVVYLQEPLIGKKDTKFTNVVFVYDNGILDDEGQKWSKADVSITVVSSDKQLPRITRHGSDGPIVLKEDYNDFSAHLVTLDAESNINDKEVVFELVKGKTAQTNKDQTFLLVPDGFNTAHIKLVRPLDYETVTEYTLTVRVKNKDFMDASINIPIRIEDVNDEIPTFLEFLRGSVVENDSPGAQAIQVRAIDKDGTSANNIVSYELTDNQDLFQIDRTTGIITSIVSFDREKVALYHVNVKAYDNSPSALVKESLEPNIVVQTFQISIEDQNDNKPRFTKPVYQFSNISESADKASIVGEIQALDNDTASIITYSILDGNTGNAFSIENTTGRIRVHSELDFEQIEQYNLTVRAFDGIFDDTARVIITILNENDEIPVFHDYQKRIEFEEERMIEGCIIQVTAYDPDIKNSSIDQHIAYDVSSQQKEFLSVSKDGCVSLTKPLDRDPPNGSPERQVFIYALDNDGGTNSLRNFVEITIVLKDINDNAPFLNVTQIVWYENQDPGLIGKLSADDNDGPENGPPFSFRLAEVASEEIQNKFSISGDELYAKVTFDREEKKYYDIPVTITDSGIPPQSGTSILRVIIGDENDNKAEDGESSIFVYKYEKGTNEEIEIGRVYVKDLDDWDLDDKIFVQQDNFDQFLLNKTNNGMILMRHSTSAGTYVVNFEVTEVHEPQIPLHTVHAVVNITVKEIPEEAVVKSGSIRMEKLTPEEFVERNEFGKSRKEILQQQLSKILNTSLENVDVFTVMSSPSNRSFLDVRFSAHGSPYYAPERLENKITEHQTKLEKELGTEFYMISINECLNDKKCGPQSSCTNELDIKPEPAVVFTNQTSFVGVNAFVQPVCDSHSHDAGICFNGGVLMENGICNCRPGFEGPRCEILGIGFTADGWATYPKLEASNKSEIVVHILSQNEDGLIFYAGPMIPRHAAVSKGFISLELKKGLPLLLLNTGSGKEEIYIDRNIRKLNDGALHSIKIDYSFSEISMEVDGCKTSCSIWKDLTYKGVLRVNGPLQMGGTKFKFNNEEFKTVWGHAPPTNVGFYGCIRNFTYNSFYYNLGAPSDQFKSYPDCNYGVMQAVTFGIDSNFLVAVLVCVAILIILLLAVVVHRRKQDSLNEKEIDDTRANIIDYRDEGGGECDANYDLSVFHQNNIVDEKPVTRDNPIVPADISGFLDTKKDTCDRDPDNLPYDDVRHYAYEGDGNSTGSLSSLASCTDDGDLKFNYLSSFGPRFRKLADMYGEDPSDDDSPGGGDESWC